MRGCCLLLIPFESRCNIQKHPLTSWIKKKIDSDWLWSFSVLHHSVSSQTLSLPWEGVLSRCFKATLLSLFIFPVRGKDDNGWIDLSCCYWAWGHFGPTWPPCLIMLSRYYAWPPEFCASAPPQGLSFHLGAVLLSLGFITYVEQGLLIPPSSSEWTLSTCILPSSSHPSCWASVDPRSTFPWAVGLSCERENVNSDIKSPSLWKKTTLGIFWRCH